MIRPEGFSPSVGFQLMSGTIGSKHSAAAMSVRCSTACFFTLSLSTSKWAQTPPTPKSRLFAVVYSSLRLDLMPRRMA